MREDHQCQNVRPLVPGDIVSAASHRPVSVRNHMRSTSRPGVTLFSGQLADTQLTSPSGTRTVPLEAALLSLALQVRPAVEGSLATQLLLPDGTTGWLWLDC